MNSCGSAARARVAAVVLAAAWSAALARGSTLVAYVTDLEGSRAKLELFFERHEAFERGADGRFHLRPGATLVHGGDVGDRFPGGQFVVGELLRLHAEAPGRVVLIAGNRDVNKLRLRCELAPGALAGAAAPAALRRILAETMGAPDAFELRRRELAERHPPAAVDDQAVVSSYLDELRDGGAFERLLTSSELAHRMGSTLFVHGGIGVRALGRVPGRADAVDDLDRWLRELNRWYRSELAQWRRGADGWDGRGPRPGEALIRYVEPAAGSEVNPDSVIYQRALDEQRKVTLPDPAVVTWLLRRGVRRLVLGHTPCGQAPVILRTPDDRFEVLVSDTSRAGRPEVPALVTLDGPGLERTRTWARVDLEDGPVTVAAEATLGVATPLGKRRPDGAVVIGRVGGAWLSWHVEPGWRVVYQVRDSAR